MNYLFSNFKKLGLFGYCFFAGAIALFGACFLVLIAILIRETFSNAHPEPEVSIVLSTVDYIGLIIFAPLVETVLLILLIRLLEKTKNTESRCIFIATLIFGSFHALVSVLNFIGSIWTFYIFTKSYFVWKGDSMTRVFIAVLLPHMYVNTAAAFLMSL